MLMASQACSVDKKENAKDIDIEMPFVYDSNGKRDPFWRLVSPEGAIVNYDADYLISDLILEGIIAEEDGRSLAIINGRVVNVADLIGQFVVSEINTNKVILTKNGQEFELRLLPLQGNGF